MTSETHDVRCPQCGATEALLRLVAVSAALLTQGEQHQLLGLFVESSSARYTLQRASHLWRELRDVARRVGEAGESGRQARQAFDQLHAELDAVLTGVHS